MSKLKIGGAIAGVTAFIASLPIIWGLVFTAFTSASGGEVIVVRNGGLLDDTSINQVIQENSGLTYRGLYSTNHVYPVSQRFFKVSPDADADSNVQINVFTADGVQVGVEGTFYFELSRDEALLKAFDDKYGTRTFNLGDQKLFPYDGSDGWQAFLNGTLSNVVENVHRSQIGGVKCADLIASCVLAQGNAETTDVPTDNATASNLERIRAEIGKKFADEVNNTLGIPLINVSYVLSKVTLPQNIQDAINSSQAAFSSVATATANQQSAQIDAETNRIKQDGYNQCPTCAEVDLRKSIPQNITVWAPGSGFAVSQPQGAGQ